MDHNEAMDKAVANCCIANLMMKTCEPLMRLKLTDTVPGLCESKVGGLPYIPHGGEVPCDENGGALRLLAQIDCSEIAVLPDFPDKGLLQFWIGQDVSWGLESREGSRVIWYETIDKTVTEEEVQAKINAAPKPADFEECFPVMGVYGIEFKHESDSMAACDAHFPPLFTEMFNAETPGDPIERPEDLGDDICEMIWEQMKSEGNKIGGHPGFTQYDPREEDDERTVLLLQLDSISDDDTTRVMWGDLGIGVFMCTPAELKARDFSNVLYSWDCC